jgi:hypothetical protein
MKTASKFYNHDFLLEYQNTILSHLSQQYKKVERTDALEYFQNQIEVTRSKIQQIINDKVGLNKDHETN